jgi:hypothetical protein
MNTLTNAEIDEKIILNFLIFPAFSSFLPACLPSILPAFLPSFLPACLPAFLPACLPFYMPAAYVTLQEFGSN